MFVKTFRLWSLGRKLELEIPCQEQSVYEQQLKLRECAKRIFVAYEGNLEFLKEAMVISCYHHLLWQLF